MGRRADHSRAELRELMVGAGIELADEGGMPAITARQVAARIGYAAGTVYNLFGDIDQLVLEVNARTLDALRASLTAAAGRGEAHIRSLAAAYRAFTRRHPRRWAMLFEHRLPSGNAAPSWFRERVEGLVAFVAEALAPLMPDQPEALRAEAAILLWSGLHGLCSLEESAKLGTVTDVPTERLVDDYVTLMLAGMAGGGVVERPRLRVPVGRRVA